MLNPREEQHRPGSVCPASGLYSVLHIPKCDGAKELGLQKGMEFPFCPVCLERARYVLARAAPSPEEDQDLS